jgi:hypothetical protein
LTDPDGLDAREKRQSGDKKKSLQRYGGSGIREGIFDQACPRYEKEATYMKGLQQFGQIRTVGSFLVMTIVCCIPGSAERSNRNMVATLGSTVPANGDVNPYGVALVPRTVGKLVEGRFLVSNFNNSANLQGTGFEG